MQVLKEQHMTKNDLWQCLPSCSLWMPSARIPPETRKAQLWEEKSGERPKGEDKNWRSVSYCCVFHSTEGEASTFQGGGGGSKKAGEGLLTRVCNDRTKILAFN